MNGKGWAIRTAALASLLVACTGKSPATGSGSTGDTGDTVTTSDTDDTGTLGTCDATETPVSFYCQSDLCNHCTSDCPDLTEQQDLLPMCANGTDYTPYNCCEVDTCTDPVLGALDRIHCPYAYGGAYWWFDPATGALVSYAWSTDYNDWCDGSSFGELFGPDLTACQ